MALSEARALIQTWRVNISRKELRERKRYSLHFSETQKIITGKNARMFVKKHFEKNESAIVARELNKPCVIGTKHDTKVFKDGDKILVDVCHGYVRKA
ncbi:MAG: hypothetical protein HY981_03545 [Candidatus Magasanikbacteria bacterium]|nr:hypothetical protein [Candidatus Magasanikbacteria bacterium]